MPQVSRPVYRTRGEVENVAEDMRAKLQEALSNIKKVKTNRIRALPPCASPRMPNTPSSLVASAEQACVAV